MKESKRTPMVPMLKHSRTHVLERVIKRIHHRYGRTSRTTCVRRNRRFGLARSQRSVEAAPKISKVSLSRNRPRRESPAAITLPEETGEVREEEGRKREANRSPRGCAEVGSKSLRMIRGRQRALLPRYGIQWQGNGVTTRMISLISRLLRKA